MRLRATFKVRNDHIVSAREKRCWSQKRTAEEAGIPLRWVGAFEKLHYDQGSMNIATRYATALADALGIQSSDVMPEHLWGVKIDTTRVAIQDVPDDHLISASSMGSSRLILPDPSENVEKIDLPEMVTGLLGYLPLQRTREMLRFRYGIESDKEHTLDECAQAFDISSERASQIIVKGIRDLQRTARRNEHPVLMKPEEEA